MSLISRAMEGAAEIGRSRARSSSIEIPAPSGLEYLPFQKAGIAYAADRDDCLIADEMGLGKTIQAIGLINLLDHRGERPETVLIIVPATLKLNWEKEANKWLVHPYNIHIVNGKKESGWDEQADFVIINYDICQAHTDALHSRIWGLMVLDESQRVKNATAGRTKAILGSAKGTRMGALTHSGKRPKWPRIDARRNMFLTGTPILNKPIEAYTVCHAIAPKEQFFESRWRFGNRYCMDNEYDTAFQGAQNVGELGRRMRQLFMIRRLKRDVLTELPKKRRQVIEMPPTSQMRVVVNRELKEWQLKEDSLEALKKRVAEAEPMKDTDTEAYEMAVSELEEERGKNFAAIAKEKHDVGVQKLPFVLAHLRDLLEEVDKVIVFAWHKEVVDGIMAEMTRLGASPVKITGETPQGQRQAAVERFQTDPTCRVFVGNIAAAGTGITLTAASTVVFAELDWVPGNMLQAEDRAHRIGQASSVLIQILVLEGSLDAVIARRLVQKMKVIEATVDQHDEIERREAEKEEGGARAAGLVTMPPEITRDTVATATRALHDIWEKGMNGPLSGAGAAAVGLANKAWNLWQKMEVPDEDTGRKLIKLALYLEEHLDPRDIKAIREP